MTMFGQMSFQHLMLGVSKSPLLLGGFGVLLVRPGMCYQSEPTGCQSQKLGTNGDIIGWNAVQVLKSGLKMKVYSYFITVTEIEIKSTPTLSP